jgi:hypothetical protein
MMQLKIPISVFSHATLIVEHSLLKCGHCVSTAKGF